MNDINTPRNQTASYEHTEYLWRRRFGMDMTPSEKFLYFWKTHKLVGNEMGH